MSYIAPETIIKLIHNVKLYNDYAHTWYPADISAQYQGISGQAKYTLTDFSYQREQRAVRVPIRNDNLYDINYMCYQNHSFGNKWFYAFVTKTEYINNELSLVYFEIDVMQTWLFDVYLQRSFIERQHVRDDTIGANLIPEPLQNGEIIDNGEVFVNLTEPFVIVVAATFKYDQSNGTFTDVGGAFYGKIFNGLYLNVFNDIQIFAAFIGAATVQNKLDGIKAVYQMPDRYAVREGGQYASYTNIISKPTAGVTALNGYIPKNNKLYTYPYYYLSFTDSETFTHDYLFEYFTDPNSATFHSFASMEVNPSVLFIPTNYAGVTGDNETEGVSISNFPQCTWNSDVFKEYMGANFFKTLGSAASYGLQAGGNIVSAVTSGVTGHFGGLANAYSSEMRLRGQFLEDVGSLIDKARKPPELKGTISSNAMFNQGLKGLYIHIKSLRADIAESYDDFFTMYGYAINRVDIPQRNERTHFTYVKTRGFNCNADIPQDDLSKIKQIYDNGITFWNTLAEISDYSVNNEPRANI